MSKNVPKKQLALNEKERIVDLYTRGYKISEISDIYQISERTSKRILKKNRDSDTLERKQGTGMNTKYNEDDLKKILTKMIRKDRALTLTDMKSKLQKTHKIKYSTANIHYILKKIGYVKKNATLKIPLSEDHLNSRENWAIYYNGYDWSNVIWSDETKICNDSNNKQKIWMLDDENIIKCKYKYPLKINVWGAIIRNKGLIFKIFENNENSDTYIEILEELIIPLCKGKKYIFQQDNAGPHTSYKLLSFFSKNKIEVMYWPPCSPDLNPIENIWNLVKTRVRKNHYNTIKEMTKEVVKILSDVSIDTINNIIDSMDNRIDALFDNNFNVINY